MFFSSLLITFPLNFFELCLILLIIYFSSQYNRIGKQGFDNSRVSRFYKHKEIRANKNRADIFNEKDNIESSLLCQTLFPNFELS